MRKALPAVFRRGLLGRCETLHGKQLVEHPSDATYVGSGLRSRGEAVAFNFPSGLAFVQPSRRFSCGVPQMKMLPPGDVPGTGPTPRPSGWDRKSRAKGRSSSSGCAQMATPARRQDPNTEGDTAAGVYRVQFTRAFDI